MHETASTVRLFRSNNVQSGRIDFEGLQFVDHSCVSDVQLMRDGDVLVCAANGSKALVGKAAIYRVQENQRYTFGAFMIVFRPSLDKGPLCQGSCPLLYFCSISQVGGIG